jgi:LysM repeat protein
VFGKLVAVLVAALLLASVIAHGSNGSGPPQHYRVRAADTLWSIAARHYAGDTREGVWKLEQRNHLTGSTLRPGQTLVLP